VSFAVTTTPRTVSVAAPEMGRCARATGVMSARRMTTAVSLTDCSNGRVRLRRGFGERRYRFLPAFFFVPVRFRGTLPPFSRASDSPIAIACFRLVTLRPDPLFSVPRFRRRIALSTFLLALFPYLAMESPPWSA
jgi:hypothetical protein